MRPILTLDDHSSTNYLYLLTPYSTIQLGDSYGSQARTDSISTVDNRSGGAVQYGDSIYVVKNGAIRKLNLSTGSWTTLATISGALTDGRAYSTMHLAFVGGVYYLAILTNVTPSGIFGIVKGAIYNLSTNTLTDGGTVAIENLSGGAGLGHSIVFGDKLFVIGQGSTGTVALTVDIPTGAIASTSLATYGSDTRGHFAIWRNAVYVLTHQSGSSATLRRYVGGSWSTVSNITATTYSSASGTHPCLFTDGDYLYAILQITDGTWAFYQTSDGVNWTNIKSTVLGTTFDQSSQTAARFRVTVDQHADPVNPVIYLMYAAIKAGGSWSFWRWNGPSAALTYIGAAGNSAGAVAICTQEYGGGDVSYSNGELNIQVHGQMEPGDTLGNSKLYFRIFESSTYPSGSPVEVKFFGCPVDENLPSTPLRLASPSDGSIYNSYTIQGLTSGSGILHSVEWRASADGYTAGDGIKIMASVSGVV